VIAFILGVFAGGFLMIGILALCAAAGEADERMGLK
jgi:hypothetical protein